MTKVGDKAFFMEMVQRLRTLRPDASPRWGSMTPQHMVEHIVGSWRISNGRARVPVMLSGEELEKRRAFLFSDKPYEKNIVNPVTGKDLPPLRKPGLKEAIDQLEDEIIAFFAYHESNPGAIENHPVFGELDKNGWLIFQTKHMQHHLSQFGL
ncbi:MAG: hypothetical protein Kow0075_17270 [Salibacteraceae bacterium]